MLDFSEIRDIMEKARKEHFTDKGLKTDDGIYYMNGNDGTDFDMEMNGRLCEFYIHKENGDGLIKFLANLDGTYDMYIFDFDNPFNGEFKLENGALDFDVNELGCCLQEKFDDNGKWDVKVESWEI